MNELELIRLAPLVSLGLTAVVLLVQASFERSATRALTTTLVGYASSLVALKLAWTAGEGPIGPSFSLDALGSLATVAAVTASAMVAATGHAWITRRTGVLAEEFHILSVLATLGAAALAMASDLVGTFVGLEITGLAMYGLVSYNLTDRRSASSAMRYLVLGAVASSFFLFGTALIFHRMGSFRFDGIAQDEIILWAGLALVLTGLAFKLALAPFHAWAADVYDGAPHPSAMILASTAKAGALAATLKLLTPWMALPTSPVAHILAGIAVLSMIVGSLLALSERRIGRMLAFSGTAQLGTLLAGFLGGTEGTYAASTYLAAYVLTSACAFGGLAWAGLDQKVETMDDLKGLAWRSPGAALTFCAGLWSLAGMPLSFGFIGKVVVLSADASAYQWLLVGTVVLSTALGAGFYLRAFVPVFQKVEGQRPASDVTAGVPLLLGLVVILLVGGLWPGPALSWIQAEVVDAMAVVP